MTTTPIAASTQSERRLQGVALTSVMGALLLTLLLEALDQTIVGTAMPRILAQLHGLDRYAWVVTAYVLASMTMIPVVGKLSDQFGRKWFLLVGTALFLLGSVLSGAAQTMDQLIIFRGLQGLGAGIGMSLVATLIADIFPPAERVKWQGMFGAIYGFANLLGPTCGGWLTEHGPLLGTLVTETTRWRWVFYINFPIGIVAIIALLIYLPANISTYTRTATGRANLGRIDFLGAFLSTVATICLLLGLTWGGNQMYAWDSPLVITTLAAGLVLFVIFLLVERRAVEPILPLELFRNQVFSVASLLSLIQMMVLLGLSLYLPLYLQGVLAVSPTNAGLIITPLSLSMVIGAALAGPIIMAFKRYQVVAVGGALLMTVGAFLITLLTPDTSLLQAILYMILVGIGTGTFFSLVMIAAQNALPASQLGIGTAAVRYLGQFGATLGIAIVGTVVNSAASSDLTRHLPTDAAGKVALAGALHLGFIAVLVFCVLGLVATLFLKDLPMVSVAKEGSEVESEAQPAHF